MLDLRFAEAESKQRAALADVPLLVRDVTEFPGFDGQLMVSSREYGSLPS